MKISITHRLFLAILAAAGLAVVSLVLIMQWNLNRGFLAFVNSMEKGGVTRLAASLEKKYSAELSWNFLQADSGLWRQLVFYSLPDAAPPPEEGRPSGPPPEGLGAPRRGFPPQLARDYDQRLFLLNSDRKVLLSKAEIPVDAETTPLRHGGRIVGYLGLLPRTQLSDAPHQRFIREQKLAFTLVAGLVVLLAAGLSLLLATRLVRPLRELAGATHRLAAGESDVRVPVASNDELGRLAEDFNALALTLEKNEQARRQWVADISHELRTPLAVLRGEIEALQDGIRQANPETIQSLHSEVLRLGRLVDDLYQLSLSDLGAMSYRKESLDGTEILLQAIDTFRPEFASKKIALSYDLGEGRACTLLADGTRLQQLFDNLLENSLKYTDPGGELRILLECRDGVALFNFMDSAPGVPRETLERLFERLYRVESSRNRSLGGAGLGLSICRNIVEAHGGTIEAKASPLGGVWIKVALPLMRGML
jgi:two-component system sensor histidine kinase BaeS